MSITPFTHEGSPVRVVIIDDAPHFVAGDVCDYFGVTNRNRVMQHIDSDEKGGTQIDTPGGRQTVTVLTESGLYHLLFILQPAKARGMDTSHIDARLQQLANFRRWITAEVLPSIRRHGGYLTPEATEAALTDPDFIIRLATSLKNERAARAAAEQEALTHRARLTLVEPKAAAFDRWMGSGAEYSIDVAAKALSAAGYLTGRNRLFLELAQLGWAYRDVSGWHPYQAHGPEGTKRLAVRVFYYDHPETGEARGKATLKITAKGIADLAHLRRILPSSVHDVIGDSA